MKINKKWREQPGLASSREYLVKFKLELFKLDDNCLDGDAVQVLINVILNNHYLEELPEYDNDLSNTDIQHITIEE